MQFTRSVLRYAHIHGYTCVIYSTDGGSIITCGNDGDVRCWNDITDDDASSTCLGEFVMCLAIKGDRLFAGTDRNTVQAFTFPDLDNDGVMLRFTAPATCVRVYENFLAAGSEDKTLKIYNLNDDTVLELVGHSGPVLSFDMYVKKHLLASIAGDGQLKIWRFANEGHIIKTIIGLAKINSFENAKIYGTPCFEPNHGRELAYVNGTKIVLLCTTTWNVLYELSQTEFISNYSCCQYSPDGSRLAAGTTSGELSIFDMQTRKSLEVEKPSKDCKRITCIAWNTSNKGELAFCDATGQLGTIFKSNDCVAKQTEFADHNEPLEKAFADYELVDDEIEIGNGDDSVAAHEMLNDEVALDGDESNDNCISIEKLKNEVMNATGIYEGGDKPKAYNADDDDDSKLSMDSNEDHIIVKSFKQQKAFQPSATPLELEHRYLVWNNVGIVTSHIGTNADGSIDVDFNDVSVHHALHITNTHRHNISSLSQNALALASTESSKLVVIALTVAGNKEWSLNMPNCEIIEGLVATTKLIAVATSTQLLRLFTLMGTQREVLSIPGPVVAVAGHEQSLLVAYHSSPANENQQYLSAMLIQVCGFNLRVQYIPVPVAPGRQLTWLGFSDVGSPIIADHMGLVQIYKQNSNVWFPVCDTTLHTSSVSNNFFIVAVQERAQIIQAVLCRGTAYPMTNPRPIIQELSMQMPMCDIEAEKSILEDELMRNSFMETDSGVKSIKETALKLFALACRGECEPRAKELVEVMACPELLQIAIKYASKLGRIHLADRLSELMPQLEAEQEARKQKNLLTSNGVIVTPIYMPTTATGGGEISTKLAPKPMELKATTKRNVLKRFSLNAPQLTPKATDGASLDTQENIFGENDPESEMLEDIVTTTTTTTEARTPLNSVNPFQMKRKLKETGVIFGSEKLKLAKK